MFSHTPAQMAYADALILTDNHIANFLKAQDDFKIQLKTMKDSTASEEYDFHKTNALVEDVKKEMESLGYLDEEGGTGIVISTVILSKLTNIDLYNESTALAHQYGFSSLEEWARVYDAISTASYIASLKAMKFYRSPELDTHKVPLENITLVEKYDPLDMLD